MFPCIGQDHRYTGCVGKSRCPLTHCWTGEQLAMPKGGLALVRVDVSANTRLQGRIPYSACECPECDFAVDVPGPHAARNGKLAETWVSCGQGLWQAPVTVYNLLHRRIPLRTGIPCPRFRRAPVLRPELLAKRAADASRARRWKEKRLATTEEALEKAS